MIDSFNLATEPWITCVMNDGAVRELSLMETLKTAHEIRDISDPSPLTVSALYRLLLANVYTIFTLPSLDDWRLLWSSGRLNPGEITDYFDRWQNRFDLLDKEHPFYQETSFPSKTKVKPLNDIIPELTQGGTSTLFDHTMDSTYQPVALPEAARILITKQAYHLGGLSGLGPNYTDAPGSRAIHFYVLGNNLFETLMLNLIPLSSLQFPSTSDDRPAWEMDGANDDTTPRGLVDYLTWQTLRLQLGAPDASNNHCVSEVTIGLGRTFNEEGLLSPFSYFKKDPKEGWKPVRFQEEKALWRDSSALFAVHSNSDKALPPDVLRWTSELVDQAVLEPGRNYQLVAYGLSARQAKINFWRSDRIPVPREYLADEALVELLDFAIARSEKVRSDIGASVFQVAKELANDNQKEAGNISAHMRANNLFWSNLEVPFFDLLSSIPGSPDESVQNWTEVLRKTAWSTFDESTRAWETHGTGLKATTVGRSILARRLSKTLAD